MTARLAIIFDAAGRPIGRELRTADQWPEDLSTLGPRHAFVDARKALEFKDVKGWWLDGDEVKPRQKVELPLPTRQRLRAQPAMRWFKVEEDKQDKAALPWKPRTYYAEKAEIAEGYVCGIEGITGDEIPKDFVLGIPGVWEHMPTVVWKKIGLADKDKPEAKREPLAMYELGDRIDVNGEVWEAVKPGASNQNIPEFTGDEVEDRDSLAIPLPAIDGPIDLLIGDERVRADGPVILTGKKSGMVAIKLDSPGYYSDEYLVAIESV